MAAVPASPKDPLQPLRLGTDNTPWWAHAIKWGLLGLILLAGAYVIQRVISNGSWLGVVITAFIVMCVLAVYSTRRAVPMKYLLPGLILLVTLQIWPIVYTVSTAFTNYGQGHTLSKEDATARTIADSVQEIPGSERYKMSVAVKEGGDPTTAELFMLLVKPDGTLHVGSKDGLTDLAKDGVEVGGTGKITKAPGYTVLNAKQGNDRSKADHPLTSLRCRFAQAGWAQGRRSVPGVRGRPHHHV